MVFVCFFQTILGMISLPENGVVSSRINSLVPYLRNPLNIVRNICVGESYDFESLFQTKSF